MPTKRTATTKAKKAAGGRPRKYSDEILVDAALRVLEREGYKALTVRSLAQELGTSHATLYNYIDSVEEIESKALHKLAGQLPLPSASSAVELRAELLDYLQSIHRLLLQHPAVLFAKAGSASARTLTEVSDRWLQVVQLYAPDQRTAVLAMSALVSSVVASLQQPIGAEARAPRPEDVEVLNSYLNDLIDLVLPALRRVPAKRGARARA